MRTHEARESLAVLAAVWSRAGGRRSPSCRRRSTKPRPRRPKPRPRPPGSARSTPTSCARRRTRWPRHYLADAQEGRQGRCKPAADAAPAPTRAVRLRAARGQAAGGRRRAFAARHCRRRRRARPRRQKPLEAAGAQSPSDGRQPGPVSQPPVGRTWLPPRRCSPRPATAHCSPRAADARDRRSLDEHGERRTIHIPAERPLTVYVDKRELVTLMTLGARPERLVLGYLRNQRLVDARRRGRVDHRRLGRRRGGGEAPARGIERLRGAHRARASSPPAAARALCSAA